MIYALIVLLVVFSAFFSASEIAYTSVNPLRLEKAAETSRTARRAHAIWKNFETALSGILIGNNLVNIGASSVATALALRIFGEESAKGPLIASVVMTLIILIFGEIMPKIIAKQTALGFSCAVSYPLTVIMVILSPIAAPVTALVNLMFRKKKDEIKVTGEDLSTMIETVGEEGVLEESDSELLQSAMDFQDTTVGEIITHRLEWEALDVDADPTEIAATVAASSYTRLPVYKHDFDHVVGVLNVNHYYRELVEHGEVKDLTALLQEPTFVYMTMKLPAALAKMRKEQNHVDFVLDEYGGVMGIVTMEDILEQIVGDIWDENDEIESDFVRTGDNTWEVDGAANVEDLFDLLDVSDRDFDSDCTTVGGWAIEMLNADPHEGDSFPYRNLHVVVTEMGENRVNRLTVVVNEETDEEEET